jgi:D-alanine-D-alanine ligase
MSKVRVAVLMGGVSSEHEVSLRSGAKVVGALDRNVYEAVPMTIGKDGRWAYDGHVVDPFEGLCFLRDQKIDCVFIALHGPFGEDGRIQGALDLLGVPYVGSGCGASALAMDKVRCKALVEHGGVRVARQLVIRRQEWQAAPGRWAKVVESELGYPCVVKEPCQGSSLHMAIPGAAAAFGEAVSTLFETASWLMVEQYLRGPEVTCGVLDVAPGKAPVALPVTEIRPVTAAYFDYVAKYTPGATTELTPAPISEPATRKVQAMAVRVHEIVGCRGLSRSDMILVDDEPIFIEVNTIPGFTETSLYPQAAAAYGLSFGDLVGMLVRSAVGVHEYDRVAG